MDFATIKNAVAKQFDAMSKFGQGGRAWQEAKEQKEEAEEHMDALTNSTHLRGD